MTVVEPGEQRNRRLAVVMVAMAFGALLTAMGIYAFQVIPLPNRPRVR